ncbi:MAG: plastocyanin/azurin family copper-binding protein [Gaiellales bacterium]
MNRVLAIAVVGVLATAGIALARPHATALHGTVGPGFSIKLQDGAGATVTHVDAGAATLVVDDLSEEHNFHLTGPGVDVSTTVSGTGTQTFQLTLADGTYSFICDPHATAMKGSFTVGSVTAPAPPPPPPPPASPPPPATKPPSVPVGATMVLALRPTGKPVLRSTKGKLITVLRPGSYKVSVRDNAATRGVRLAGAGATKSTTKAYVGSTSWSLKLKQGTLRVSAVPTAGKPAAVAVG